VSQQIIGKLNAAAVEAPRSSQPRRDNLSEQDAVAVARH